MLRARVLFSTTTGEVKHLSCASGRKSSPGSSAGSCQTSKLKAEIKELKRENAKLQVRRCGTQAALLTGDQVWLLME